MVVEAKFYCPSCNKIWSESQISKEVGALVNEPEKPYVCPDCGSTLEYAIWRVMVERYAKMSRGLGFEEAKEVLRDKLENGVGHDVSDLYDLAECLNAALWKVYGVLDPSISIEPYISHADDCRDDDLEATTEIKKKDRRFKVILQSFGGCPFCTEEPLQEILRQLDEFLRESIEAWKIYFSD